MCDSAPVQWAERWLGVLLRRAAAIALADKEFHSMFCNLHPTILRYLELRRRKQLPNKLEGYESLYLLANSFTGLIDALQPDPDADD
jgi:hypothetical protein